MEWKVRGDKVAGFKCLKSCHIDEKIELPEGIRKSNDRKQTDLCYKEEKLLSLNAAKRKLKREGERRGKKKSSYL